MFFFCKVAFASFHLFNNASFSAMYAIPYIRVYSDWMEKICVVVMMMIENDDFCFDLVYLFFARDPMMIAFTGITNRSVSISHRVIYLTKGGERRGGESPPLVLWTDQDHDE